MTGGRGLPSAVASGLADALGLVASALLARALFGDLLPGRLSGRAMPGRRLAGHMAFDGNGTLGLPPSIAATVAVAIVLSAFVCIVPGKELLTLGPAGAFPGALACDPPGTVAGLARRRGRRAAGAPAEAD